MNNLPSFIKADSAASTKLFFDTYGSGFREFNAIDIDAATAFFTEKGFSKDAALITASTILKQSKIDGVPVFEILDTIKGFDSLQLNQLIASIMNNERVSTSVVGFKVDSTMPKNIERNILP